MIDRWCIEDCRTVSWPAMATYVDDLLCIQGHCRLGPSSGVSKIRIEYIKYWVERSGERDLPMIIWQKAQSTYRVNVSLWSVFKECLNPFNMFKMTKMFFTSIHYIIMLTFWPLAMKLLPSHWKFSSGLDWLIDCKLCFIFSGHINLTWDLCTVGSF